MMDAEPLFIDTNILIYANVASAPFHQQAFDALILTLGSEPFISFVAFLAIENMPVSSRLERRIRQIEKLSPKPRQQITQLIDTFVEAEQLKQKANAN